VYFDTRRMAGAGEWKEGLAAGLLHSLCCIPLLSYGATSPLAPSQHPGLGRLQLAGTEEDEEDVVLEELIISTVLLAQAKAGKGREGMQPGSVHSWEGLQEVFPVLVGRQEPKDHPEYPRMGRCHGKLHSD
jgi:hypothetical protein